MVLVFQLILFVFFPRGRRMSDERVHPAKKEIRRCFENRAVADLGIEGGGLIYGKPTTLDFAS